MSKSDLVKLKKVFIVRHADPCDEGHHQKIFDLADKLKTLIKPGYVVRIFTSPTRPARYSTKTICWKLNLESEDCELLHTENVADYNVKYPKALKMIRELENEVDVIILVTNNDFMGFFPNDFARIYLHADFLHDWMIPPGSAWQLNCENCESGFSCVMNGLNI